LDSLIIMPSRNSEDVMAIVFASSREVVVFYRKK